MAPASIDGVQPICPDPSRIPSQLRLPRQPRPIDPSWITSPPRRKPPSPPASSPNGCCSCVSSPIYLSTSPATASSEQPIDQTLQVSIVSAANTLQSYLSLHGTQKVYSGPLTSSRTTKTSSGKPVSNSPVTPLSARTFGTWTLLSAIVRFQAALAIHDPVAYRLAFASYVLAGAHFFSEWLVFGTVRVRTVAGMQPLVVASVSGVWMWGQWGFYVPWD